MIRLDIKNEDGSNYWSETFISQQGADNWLAEEKSRPYWDNSRTHSFTELVEIDYSNNYEFKRSREYPSIGDQLDAIYKKLELNDSTDWDVIAAKIDAVKKKHPKPE